MKHFQWIIFAEIYNILVVTSDKVGAGTDANVYITIYGECGDTGKIYQEVNGGYLYILF